MSQGGYKPESNLMQRRVFFLVSIVVVLHKTLGRGLSLINQNAKKGEPKNERNAVLYTRTDPKRKKGDRGWTQEFTVCWTCLGKSEERKRDRERKRES